MFGVRGNLTSYLDSVFHAKTEKKDEAEDFPHLEKDVFWGKNDTLRVIRIFRLEISICSG